MNELLQEGKYRINNQFEHDENSCVYEAFDTVNNKNVVIKEIPVKLNKVTTHSQQESMKIAFANEAKVLTEIKHESLVRVLDFFSEIGRQYLVLETVDGRDLAELVKESGAPFDYAEVTQWADQLLDALTYLHQFKPPVMHRAIKPKNLKLAADGKVKLIAYSMADGTSNLDTAENGKDAALNFSPIEIIWDSLDSASQKVISNSYDERSEGLLKQPADAKSDVFGLASTLYFLLTAKTPVDSLERSIELLEGKADPLSPPHVVDPSVPIEVSNVVMRAMEIKRENRFESASMMRQALKTSVVLIKEREASQALKQNDALLDQNIAHQREESIKTNGFVNEPVVAPLEAFAPQAEAPVEVETVFAKTELSEADTMKQQLRDLEAQRKLAEERASEAERLLRERDLALNPLVHAERKDRPEPDAYVPATSDETVNANILSAETLEERPHPEPDVFVAKVLEEAKPEPLLETFAAPAETLLEHTSLSPEAASVAPVLELSYADSNPLESLSDPISLGSVIDAPIDEEAEVSAYESMSEEKHLTSPVSKTYETSSFTSSYAENNRSGFPLSMPMLAGIAAVLVIIVIGGWFLLGGSPAPEQVVVPEPVAVQPQEQVQEQTIVEPETAVTTEPEVTSETDQLTLEPVEENPTAAQTSAKAQPVRQPVKVKQNAAAPATTAPGLPPPPKTQTAKKKLTVDDLLKDN